MNKKAVLSIVLVVCFAGLLFGYNVTSEPLPDHITEPYLFIEYSDQPGMRHPVDTVQNEHLHEKHPMGVVSTYGRINPDSGEGTFYISYQTFNALEEDLDDVLTILDEEFEDSESWSYEIVGESGD